MSITGIIKSAYSVALRPGIFFQGKESHILEKESRWAIAVLLGGGTLLLFATSWLNIENLQKANMAMSAFPGVNPSFGKFSNAIPWNRLTIPVFWLFYIGMTGFTRHLATIVFGEKPVSLRTSVSISAFSVLPFLFVMILMGIYSNLFPTIPAPGTPAVPGYVVVLTFLLLIAVWLWEGYICIWGFRILYTQNRGRALLTFLSPVPVFLAGCCFAGGVIYFMMRA